MAYLIAQDYTMLIDPTLRAQINNLAMARAELTAIEEINGYVSKKYDTSAEFTDTSPYAPGVTYKAANRVYIVYPAYITSSSYMVGNIVTFGNNAFVCTAATTGTFDATKWQPIAPLYTLYYAVYPRPLFNVYHAYNVGDVVFWKDHTYTCRVASAALSGFQQLQYGEYGQVPLANVFPDDALHGAANWTDNGPYIIPANTLTSAPYNTATTYSAGNTVTFTDNNVYTCLVNMTGAAGTFDPTKWQLLWQLGDNRSQLMVTHVINIALYWAHYSIAPDNVPEERRTAYSLAKEWCRNIRNGIVATPLLPLQPQQGQRILGDSEVKRGNGFV